MSKTSKRKSSETGKQSDIRNPSTAKDTSVVKRQSVFERLGTKASSSRASSERALSVNTSIPEAFCRSWALTGTCSHDKSCKLAHSHTLISPSKRSSIKKDSEIVHVSGVDKNRLVSSVKHQSPDVGTWDNFEPTELEYEDEKVLEKRRAALQRELELQMKKDGSRKEVVKTRRSSSTSSLSSTSSVSSSSSTSSRSSVSVAKKTVDKKRHLTSSSSESEKKKSAMKGSSHKDSPPRKMSSSSSRDQERSKGRSGASSPLRQLQSRKRSISPPRKPSPKTKGSNDPYKGITLEVTLKNDLALRAGNPSRRKESPVRRGTSSERRSRRSSSRSRRRSPVVARSAGSRRSRPRSPSRPSTSSRVRTPERKKEDERKKDDRRDRKTDNREKKAVHEDSRGRDKARDLAREKERLEALERCRERQREREKEKDRLREDRDRKDVKRSNRDISRSSTVSSDKRHERAYDRFDRSKGGDRDRSYDERERVRDRALERMMERKSVDRNRERSRDRYAERGNYSETRRILPPEEKNYSASPYRSGERSRYEPERERLSPRDERLNRSGYSDDRRDRGRSRGWPEGQQSSQSSRYDETSRERDKQPRSSGGGEWAGDRGSDFQEAGSGRSRDWESSRMRDEGGDDWAGYDRGPSGDWHNRQHSHHHHIDDRRDRRHGSGSKEKDSSVDAAKNQDSMESLGKRSGAIEETDEPIKRSRLSEPPALEELSDISDDDDILNRVDPEFTEGEDSRMGDSSQAAMCDTSSGQGERTDTHIEDSMQAPSPKLGEDENMVGLDFEEISDEELEEESKINKGGSVGDALGVDWASLMAECRPKKKPEENGVSSVRARWEANGILSRLSVSASLTSPEYLKKLKEKFPQAVPRRTVVPRKKMSVSEQIKRRIKNRERNRRPSRRRRTRMRMRSRRMMAAKSSATYQEGSYYIESAMACDGGVPSWMTYEDARSTPVRWLYTGSRRGKPQPLSPPRRASLDSSAAVVDTREDSSPMPANSSAISPSGTEHDYNFAAADVSHHGSDPLGMTYEHNRRAPARYLSEPQPLSPPKRASLDPSAAFVMSDLELPVQYCPDVTPRASFVTMDVVSVGTNFGNASNIPPAAKDDNTHIDCHPASSIFVSNANSQITASQCLPPAGGFKIRQCFSKTSCEHTTVLGLHRTGKVIKYFREHPILWDSTHPNFKDPELTSSLLTALASQLDETVSKVKRRWSELKLAYKAAYIKCANTGLRSQSRNFDAMGFMEREIKLELLKERFEMDLAHHADNCVVAAAKPSCDGYENPSDTYEDSRQIPDPSAMGHMADVNGHFSAIAGSSPRRLDGVEPAVDPSAPSVIGVMEPSGDRSDRTQQSSFKHPLPDPAPSKQFSNMVIDYFREHPILWDSTHPKFKDRELTSSLLTALASQLDETVSKVKRRWSKLKLAYKAAYIKCANTGLRSQSRNFDAMGFMERQIILQLWREQTKRDLAQQKLLRLNGDVKLAVTDNIRDIDDEGNSESQLNPLNFVSVEMDGSARKSISEGAWNIMPPSSKIDLSKCPDSSSSSQNDNNCYESRFSQIADPVKCAEEADLPVERSKVKEVISKLKNTRRKLLDEPKNSSDVTRKCPKLYSPGSTKKYEPQPPNSNVSKNEFKSPSFHDVVQNVNQFHSKSNEEIPIKSSNSIDVFIKSGLKSPTFNDSPKKRIKPDLFNSIDVAKVQRNSDYQASNDVRKNLNQLQSSNDRILIESDNSNRNKINAFNSTHMSKNLENERFLLRLLPYTEKLTHCEFREFKKLTTQLVALVLDSSPDLVST